MECTKQQRSSNPLVFLLLIPEPGICLYPKYANLFDCLYMKWMVPDMVRLGRRTAIAASEHPCHPGPRCRPSASAA
jgi:hypothetical protein